MGFCPPEGRFHHDGEAAFYCSPTPQAASIAIDRYVGKNDPTRVICKLSVDHADVFDLRTADQTTEHIDPAWGSVQWALERAAGQPATTWRASDAVRTLDVDGMIYTSRTAPDRWHLLLFRWNELGGPKIRLLGTEEWSVGKYPKPAL